MEALLEIKKQDDTYEKELAFISKNAGIGGGNILIGNVVSYLSTILATRVVGAELFGIFFLANTILLTAVLLSSSGLNQAVLRYVSLYQGQKDYARIKGTTLFGVKVTLLISILVTILILFGSPMLANKIFDKPDLEVALQVLVLALPFAAVTEILLSGLQGLRFIGQSVFVKNTFLPILRLILLVIFFAFGFRLSGLLFATFLSFVIGWALAYFYLKRKPAVLEKGTLAISERSKIIGFSTPLYFDGILNYIIVSIPVFMLGYFGSSSEVGIFGIGVRLALIASLPLASINLIFAPTISNLYGRGEKEALVRLFKTVTKWIFTISFAVSLLLILFAKPVLSIFGPNFVVGTAALYFLVLGELVNAAVGSSGYMLMMTGRPKINLMNSTILFVLTLVLGMILIPRFGLLGAALTSAISIATINTLRLIEVYYFEGIHPYNLKFAKPLVAGILSFLSVFVFRIFMPKSDVMSLVLSLIIFGLMFFSALWVLKLEDEDKYVLELLSSK